MSYGLSVVSESGFTQIDSTYDNVAVYASGTMNSSYYGGTVTTTAIPANTPVDYLIFCKPTTESGTHRLTLATYTDGSGFSFYNQYGQNTVISVDWVIAIRSRDMPANNSPDYGLEVYKANGEESFSSNNANFRCLQVSFDNITSSTQSGATFSLGSMANIYSLMSGKTVLGRVPVSSQNSALYSLFVEFDYSAKTIKSVGAPVALIGPGSSAIAGGFKTNLIGSFT
tara:strand:+ start:459 stop:1139 length:681 start_codon:yes stop_codon:yes gene_type:complete